MIKKTFTFQRRKYLELHLEEEKSLISKFPDLVLEFII